MKTRFLDVRNCHALLPQGHGLSLVQRLEECLQGVNDADGPLRGSIDRLVAHNQKTLNQRRGSERFLDSPVEVGQAAILADRLINTRAIVGQVKGPAKYHTNFAYEDGTYWKTIVPLQFLLKGWGDANDGHQCYVHTISQNRGEVKSVEDWQARVEADSSDYYYVGITGRNWLVRFSEHMGDMRRGSRKRFHQAWRDNLGIKDVLFTSSLMDINRSYEEAMEWEEAYVDRYASDSQGLNMIAGGFKGLRELHKLGIIARDDISLEQRSAAMAEYLRQHPRKGVPNPFLAELWKDDDYYLKVIATRPKTLSPEQVREIRRLAAVDTPVDQIAETVGALNEIQVKNVIVGKTYNRVH